MSKQEIIAEQEKIIRMTMEMLTMKLLLRLRATQDEFGSTIMPLKKGTYTISAFIDRKLTYQKQEVVSVEEQWDLQGIER